MRVGLMAIALLVSACSSVPAVDEAVGANYGAYPENYEQIVRDYYGRSNLNPASIRYHDISAPVQFAWRRTPGAPPYLGYAVCADFSWRRPMGEARALEAVLIRDGQAVHAISGSWIRGEAEVVRVAGRDEPLCTRDTQ